MTTSASVRETKREQTERRITVCAQRLTDQHGLDGFTMEDLAAAADVSRRTLFNYFPGKLDAVMGGVPALDPDDLATFRAGGPGGRLVDDLAALAGVLLRTEGLDREQVGRRHRLLTTEPRLLMLAHQRFEEVTGDFVSLILEREGEEYGAGRARLLVRLLVSVFDAALLVFVAGDDRPLDDLFHETVRTARDLLA